MHMESVKAIRPGIPYMEVYELSARVMVDGMKALGLMKGNTEDAVELEEKGCSYSNAVLLDLPIHKGNYFLYRLHHSPLYTGLLSVSPHPISPVTATHAKMRHTLCSFLIFIFFLSSL